LPSTGLCTTAGSWYAQLQPFLTGTNTLNGIASTSIAIATSTFQSYLNTDTFTPVTFYFSSGSFDGVSDYGIFPRLCKFLCYW